MFPDRLLDIATHLRAYAGTIALEIERMEAAQSCFQKRVAKRAGGYNTARGQG